MFRFETTEKNLKFYHEISDASFSNPILLLNLEIVFQKMDQWFRYTPSAIDEPDISLIIVNIVCLFEHRSRFDFIAFIVLSTTTATAIHVLKTH